MCDITCEKIKIKLTQEQMMLAHILGKRDEIGIKNIDAVLVDNFSFLNDGEKTIINNYVFRINGKDYRIIETEGKY